MTLRTSYILVEQLEPCTGKESLLVTCASKAQVIGFPNMKICYIELKAAVVGIAYYFVNEGHGLDECVQMCM